ncbi:hypothetical protein NliqN6_5357 [Naganishia liquefaciens]|uniref:Uncharacterized protein n=1 Tax=Naganishia liquefaciens TaxID=104408 RepID=A0A8H3TXC6_9TREE|nr:hypothetical protein NliqN6_5357 [Naganishia liquefaciens]
MSQTNNVTTYGSEDDAASCFTEARGTTTCDGSSIEALEKSLRDIDSRMSCIEEQLNDTINPALRLLSTSQWSIQGKVSAFFQSRGQRENRSLLMERKDNLGKEHDELRDRYQKTALEIRRLKQERENDQRTAPTPTADGQIQQWLYSSSPKETEGLNNKECGR